MVVGNGESMHCLGMCHKVAKTIGSTPFTVVLNVVPFHDMDMVLGVEWWQSLCPMTLDCAKMTLFFTFHNELITLTSSSPSSQEIGSPQLCHDIINNEYQRSQIINGLRLQGPTQHIIQSS